MDEYELMNEEMRVMFFFSHKEIVNKLNQVCNSKENTLYYWIRFEKHHIGHHRREKKKEN